MYHLYRFCPFDGQVEYLIISADDEATIAAHGEPTDVIEIDGDASAFPCDQELMV